MAGFEARRSRDRDGLWLDLIWSTAQDALALHDSLACALQAAPDELSRQERLFGELAV